MASLISEGITFKKPGGGINTFRTLGKRRNDCGTETIDFNVFRTFEPPQETISKRIELCAKICGQITDHLKSVQEMYKEELNENLQRFMCRSFLLVEKEENALPVGVLESGLSLSENSSIFDNIRETIQSLGSKSSNTEEKIVVARIQSSSSCTSAKAIFQSICKQIIYYKEILLDGTHDEIAKDNNWGKKYFSLHDVRLVFKRKINYKIVILVEDLDYFPNSVILQLMMLMGNAQLPIIFLLGTAHGNSVSNLIPLNSSSTFVIDKFYCVSPKDRFDAVMKLVVFDSSIPFKISADIVSYLKSQFIEDNFSLNCVFNIIMLCVRSHFLTAGSAFCELKKSSKYSDEMMQNFINFTEPESCTTHSLLKRQKRNEANNEFIDSTVDQLTRWCFTLKFVCFLNEKLVDRPLGDTYSHVYIACYNGYTLSNESEPNNPFHKFLNCLRRVSPSDLNGFLNSAINFLKSLLTSTNLPNCEIIEDLINQLEIISCELNHESIKPEIPNGIKSVRIKKKAQNLQTLQQHLLEVKREKEGTSTVYQVHTKLIECIRTILKLHLPPLSSFKYSRIFLFSDLNQLIAGLFPSNVLRINADLSNPGEILQCSCCSSLDSLSVDKNLPDVSIVHKLILEHTTKKVNLNSVYETFKTVVQPFKSKDSATGSMLIRFRRAVGELQHMGFIKRSKYRPDEISKLTWL